MEVAPIGAPARAKRQSRTKDRLVLNYCYAFMCVILNIVFLTMLGLLVFYVYKAYSITMESKNPKPVSVDNEVELKLRPLCADPFKHNLCEACPSFVIEGLGNITVEECKSMCFANHVFLSCRNYINSRAVFWGNLTGGASEPWTESNDSLDI